MTFLKKIFSGNNQNTFNIRFSKSENNWQVYLAGNLVYIGQKSDCQMYMNNMKPTV